ncbi:hypothetical protein ASG11_04350 [Sphingomonas sp. Leaf357]|nr:hypothetical protein ASG11_04350 [Sphingomonas sp. Leaf357]
MKAVFDIKSGSGYNDALPDRYQFPDRRDYLDAAFAAVGDWVLFRESQRNGGRRAYVAVARIESVTPDPIQPNHHVATLADYLEFPDIVPLATNGRYQEALFRAVANPSLAGRAVQGKSVRSITSEDFAAIVLAGLSETLATNNARRVGLEAPPPLPQADDPPETVDRVIKQMLVNRKVRDANFRLEVCRAYDDRCAVTGLRIINGGGRSEVQAAHIRPVGKGGPDTVRNGMALSATVHWLFDRYLISVSEDYSLLVAHNRVPSQLLGLFRSRSQGLHLPRDRAKWPHPRYLAHHRDAFANASG